MSRGPDGEPNAAPRDDAAIQAATKVAYAALREGILRGVHQPGEHLPAAKIAAALAISRTPVREALLLLETEGLVTSVLHRGFRVRQLSRASIEKLYDLRAMLEGFAAGKAAEGVAAVPEHQIDLLWEEVTRHDTLIGAPDLHDPVNIDAMMEANARIHETIVAISGYPMLKRLIAQTIDPRVVYRAFDLFSRDQLRRTNDFHRMVIERIVAGDADRASSLMSEHVFQSRDIVLARLDDAGGDVSAVFHPL